MPFWAGSAVVEGLVRSREAVAKSVRLHFHAFRRRADPVTSLESCILTRRPARPCDREGFVQQPHVVLCVSDSFATDFRSVRFGDRGGSVGCRRHASTSIS